MLPPNKKIKIFRLEKVPSFKVDRQISQIKNELKKQMFSISNKAEIALFAYWLYCDLVCWKGSGSRYLTAAFYLRL